MHREKAYAQAMYDANTHIEAVSFEGLVQAFPQHFHPYYVLGHVQKGYRRLLCRAQRYTLGPGDATLFAPGECHACEPISAQALDYHALHIPRGVLRRFTAQLTGMEADVCFAQPILREGDLTRDLDALYNAEIQHAPVKAREDALRTFLEKSLAQGVAELLLEQTARDESMEELCRFIRSHLTQDLSLNQLAAYSGMSTPTLLRGFTRFMGVAPHRYIQSLRVDRAKELLERGVPPVRAALEAGFTDQSHLTNCFKMFIGLTPGQYQRVFLAHRSKGMKKEAFDEAR